MRVNLNCPFADKDHAKRLGARWDHEKRVWYVVDPPDLLVFSRWLRAYPATDLQEKAARPKKEKKQRHSNRKPKKHIVQGQTHAVTGPAVVEHCGCNVEPWEDCEHTEALAQLALSDQYQIALEIA